MSSTDDSTQAHQTPDSQTLAKGSEWRPKFLWIFYAVIVVTFQLSSQTTLLPNTAALVWTNEGLVAVDGKQAPEPYTCPFRDYEKNSDRFYGLSSESYPPAFLRTAFYIYAKPPIILPVASPTPEYDGKVCLRPQYPGETITMDGTNPTMLSLERLLKEVPPEHFPLKQILAQHPSAMYLVASTFKKNNQCQYFSSGPKFKRTRFEAMPGREVKEADICIIDSNIRTLWQTHIWNASSLHDDPRTRFQNASHYGADDMRLFVHDGQVWASYKRYDSSPKPQKINRIRFEFQPLSLDSPFLATADPAEEIELCCGRNFGALSQKWHPFIDSRAPVKDGNLSFLTWPDPVWVQSLDTRETVGKTTVQFIDPTHIKSRMANKKSSDFHGTSNQLLYIAEWDEYLSVGHIHRERKWNGDKRKDAKYGHHYTHSFFTISGHPPYRLARLSQEFVFPSKVSGFTKDADIVQFASGLEWASETQIAIGYGINDCEGAIVNVNWTTVKSMLLTVEDGTHVAHTMGNMTREEFTAKILAPDLPLG